MAPFGAAVGGARGGAKGRPPPVRPPQAPGRWGTLANVVSPIRDGQAISFGTMPLISVVIPVHGVEEYLDRCLDSMLGPAGLAACGGGAGLAACGGGAAVSLEGSAGDAPPPAPSGAVP